jgi:hypothetical protein
VAKHWKFDESVYNPFFFMETPITGIVYLDMLQQFLIPQLDEDDEEGRIHVQQYMHFLIILKKFASTSTQVSQVSGFVDRR